MTPYEFQRCIQRVRVVWGTNAHSWDQTEQIYRKDRRLRSVTLEAFMAAIASYELEGLAWAPSYPQVLTRAAPVTGYDTPERPSTSGCNHPTISQLGNIEICAVCLAEKEAGTEWAVPTSV